jgi:hypothetical protein
MNTFFAVSDRVRNGTGGHQVPWLRFDGSGQIFREQSFLARGVPVAGKVEKSVTNYKMAKMKADLADALAKLAAADGNVIEMTKLQTGGSEVEDGGGDDGSTDLVEQVRLGRSRKPFPRGDH